MKESYEKGLAQPLGPKTYADDGNAVGVGMGKEVHAGQVLNSPLLRSKQGIPSACRPCSDLGKATRTATLRASRRPARLRRLPWATLCNPFGVFAPEQSIVFGQTWNY